MEQEITVLEKFGEELFIEINGLRVEKVSFPLPSQKHKKNIQLTNTHRHAWHFLRP